MRIRSYHLFILMSVLVLLLAACSEGDDQSSLDDPVIAIETPADQAVASEVTNTPGSTVNSMAAVEPTVTIVPTAATESTTESPQDDGQHSSSSTGESPGDLVAFVSETTPITLEYPSDWSISEDPSFGLLLESSEGFIDILPGGDGAILFVIPQDPNVLEGENATAKLLTAILRFGLPGSAEIVDPDSFTIDDQEFAVSKYVDNENDVDGFFALIVNEDQAAVVFSAASGEDRAHNNEILDSILRNVILVDGG